MLVMPSDVATLSYIAGLFDGEGSVSINATGPRKNDGAVNVSHRLVVNISNNDEAIMFWLRTEMGGLVHSSLSRLSTKRNYRWIAQGKNARIFLAAIHPYVRIKRERVGLALEFLHLTLNRETRHKDRIGATPLQAQEVEAREAMRQRMLRLNDRHIHTINRMKATA